jgi:cephalosporin hydroxylase
MRAAARALTMKVLRSVLLPHQASVIEKFNYIYFHGTAGIMPTSTVYWLGVKTLKCPLDLWIYQEIIFRTQPDVIVECGVYAGGSGLYLASVCDLVGKGHVIGCDVTLDRVHEKARTHPRIRLLEGSSTDQDIVAEVSAFCAGKRTMVILDSDHSEAHVSEEMAVYSPLVSRGCYLIVEDSIVNGHPAYPDHGPGPYEAIQKFMASASGWKRDRDCERLLLTFNPRGYLVREGITPSADAPLACRASSRG